MFVRCTGRAQTRSIIKISGSSDPDPKGYVRNPDTEHWFTPWFKEFKDKTSVRVRYRYVFSFLVAELWIVIHWIRTRIRIHNFKWIRIRLRIRIKGFYDQKRIRIANPNPDTDPGTPLNSDPDCESGYGARDPIGLWSGLPIRIRIQGPHWIRIQSGSTALLVGIVIV